MALETPILAKSFAASSLLASANLVVIADGIGQVGLPGGAGATKVVGVTQHAAVGKGAASASAPWVVDVVVHGIWQCITDGSGALGYGDYLQVADTSGYVKAVTVGYGGGSVVSIVGMALTSVAATSGLKVDVLLTPGNLCKP